MTFAEWYGKLDNMTHDHERLERALGNLMFLAWQEGHEQGERDEEDRHIGKDL